MRTLSRLVVWGLLLAENVRSLTNWSNNLRYHNRGPVQFPTNLQELQQLIKDSGGRVRIIGTKHSFSDVADTEGILLSLEKFKTIHVDREKMTVSIGAGVTYHELLEELKLQKLAIDNVPSLPHLSVVGSLVTGTHGGGVTKPEIAESAVEMTVVTSAGNVAVLERGRDAVFEATVHSFGLLARPQCD